MMMPKYLSSDYNVPAQSTSFRRSIASSRVVEGAGPGSLPNFPHQQLPVNVSSVDESKSPKCAHDACDSSTKEQESSEAPSSSFDSCTKGELLFHGKCRTITKEFIGCFDTLAVSTVQRRSMR
jgi:hypothetical protein